MRRYLAALLVTVAFALAVVTAGCSSESGDEPDGAASSPAEQDEQRFPDVVDATARRTGDTYSFDVTISSPYDSPERYADGWRVLGPDGTVYGEHTLRHDHAGEQPFTRTQTDVSIPDDVTEVTIEARDQRYGYGGDTVTVELP